MNFDLASARHIMSLDLSMVYGKTGKGAMAMSSKSKSLPSNLMRILSLVDGKSSVEELLAANPKLSDFTLDQALSQLANDGYIKVLRSGPSTVFALGSKGPSTILVAEADVEEFFAAQQKMEAISIAKANADAQQSDEFKAREIAADRARNDAVELLLREGEEKARAEAEAKARKEAAARAKAEAEERARREVEEKARAAAELRARIEAEHKAREETAAKAKAEAGEKARARVEAEAKAKALLEEKRKAEEEVQAREIAEAIAKKEAARKAREGAEAKEKAEAEARKEAERKVREEAETLAKAQAEERKRIEAEEKARVKAEEEARKEAERKVREEAETLARTQAEERKQIEAEERARAKAEEEARKEAERKAREEAKALAKAEAEERKRLEAEEKARIKAEEKARKEAERKAREEAEALAKAEAEERKRLAAEEKARVEAEARSRAEEESQARMEAERKAREEAETKARTEAEERAQREAEKRAAAEAEARANAKAEAKARQEAKKEERERAEIEAKARSLAEARAQENATTLQAKVKIRKPRKPFKLGRTAQISLALLVLIPLVLLHVVSLNIFAPSIAKLAADRIHEPVMINSVRASLWPSPHLRLEGVTIGNLQDVKIATVRAMPALTHLFDETKILKAIEVESLAINQDALPRVLGWLGSGGGVEKIQVEKIFLKNAKLDLRGMQLPLLNMDIDLASGSTFKHALISSADNAISIDVLPKGETFDIKISAKNWQPPLALKPTFDELNAKATATREGMAINDIEGRLYGGTIKGTATVKWDNRWNVAGDFNLSRVDLEGATPALSDNLALRGRLDAKATYAMEADNLARLFDTPRIKASFISLDGAIGNIDLSSGTIGRKPEEVKGGQTKFARLTGNMALAGNRYKFRQMKLESEVLKANGEMDILSNKELTGKINVEMSLKSAVYRSHLFLAGNLRQPLMRRANMP